MFRIKGIFSLHFMLLVVSINLSKPGAPPPPPHTNPRGELPVVYSVLWCCTLQSVGGLLKTYKLITDKFIPKTTLKPNLTPP